MPRRVKIAEAQLTRIQQENAELRETVSAVQSMESMLTESIAALELALDDVGWVKLGMESEREFSRDGLKKITALARIMWLKNPLIKRGVNVQGFYVFGQGMSISSKTAPVNQVLQRFLDDEDNQAELTSPEAYLEKERDLQIEGNLFFAFFTNATTGRVKVSSIPFDEVADVIRDPNNRRRARYYKRVWIEDIFDEASGVYQPRMRTAYYPDWRYRPTDKPQTINWDPVMWDVPVYHVKTGGLSGMRFGVPEVYAAIDWARAYKDFLENWSTIVAAYARFAWKRTGMKGPAQIAADKAKIGTTQSLMNSDTNPPPLTGSVALLADGQDLSPIRTAGATTSADDARRLLLMVAASVGLPETFFGDASVGTLATAHSLDRPTELMMISRQTFWRGVFTRIVGYVILQAVRAGELDGFIEEDDDGTPKVILGPDPDDPEVEEMDATPLISFPPILEHDVDKAVAAIVSAATLNGQAAAGTIPDTKELSRMLLSVLGEPDVDGMLKKLFPEEGELTAEAQTFVEVVRELKENLVRLGENMTPADWANAYDKGKAHWAVELDPSKFAQEFAEKMAVEKSLKVLEIGCGNGRDSIYFARAGYETTAIDVAKSAVTLAQQNAAEAEVNCTFTVANAEKMPFKDGSFDALFSVSVLHSSNLNLSIPETARVLRKGGVAFIHIYADTTMADGKVEVHISIDDYLTLLKSSGYEVTEFYSEPEDSADAEGEKHLVTVARLRRL